MLNIYDFYDKMEKSKIMLSFKGGVTSELLTSILQIMENKLEHLDEPPKTRKKVFNVLVECLQNLYHHIDDVKNTGENASHSAIFMISRANDHYSIITGNFISSENVPKLKERIEKVNAMDKEQLKEYYMSVLNNGELSEKGGGGLGIIDIARKSGQKLEYNFETVDDKSSFFSLNVKVAQ
jgi:archaellum component FlaC